MTIYSQGFYELVKDSDIKDYKALAELITIYFARMDAKYYSELEGKHDDMKHLVDYLNESAKD